MAGKLVSDFYCVLFVFQCFVLLCFILYLGHFLIRFFEIFTTQNFGRPRNTESILISKCIIVSLHYVFFTDLHTNSGLERALGAAPKITGTESWQIEKVRDWLLKTKREDLQPQYRQTDSGPSSFSIQPQLFVVTEE